jgi:2-polyprenyl-6-methoxyphenol hydroxylase-like FAD-dependent oxidoreductase
MITVGGGMAATALANAMASAGYRVLVAERETAYRDRVRGEWLAPWGVLEARRLGLYEALKERCGHEPPFLASRLGPVDLPTNDLTTTYDTGESQMMFYHPEMQEDFAAAAERSGAEVRRGVKVVSVEPGREPRATLQWEGGSETLSARLIVGADGRNSNVRKWAGFTVREDEPVQFLAGVLLENVGCRVDASFFQFNPFIGQMALLFPQGDGRARAYFGARKASGKQLSGDGDFPRFINECIATGVPPEYYADARQAGPLATFDGYDSWVDHPYRDGVALIGDAATTTDQTWGQGMALGLRDARELRDALLANDDWDAAGHAYADAQPKVAENIRNAEKWMTTFFMDPGPDAAAIREKALPLVAADRSRVPDTFIAGPDVGPATEQVRRRFFGEE